MSAANKLPSDMSVTDFLAWDPPDGDDRWELIDGVPHAMSPAAPRHGAVLAEASRRIGNHLAGARPACRVVIEGGVQPKVRANINVRVPDLAVKCAPLEPGDRLLRKPLVVLEILSPSNKAATWANVWSCTTIPSVQEILVLQSTEIQGHLLPRQDDGDWPDNPQLLAPGDMLRLDGIGLTAPIAAFYRTA